MSVSCSELYERAVRASAALGMPFEPAQPAEPKTLAERAESNEPYHPLEDVFRAVLDQCTNGKGVRHGGGVTPFREQPIFHYAQMHGRGFLTGQAAKKAEEAASTRSGQAFIDEILGAIVYLGAAVIWEREKMSGTKADTAHSEPRVVHRRESARIDGLKIG